MSTDHTSVRVPDSQIYNYTWIRKEHMSLKAKAEQSEHLHKFLFRSGSPAPSSNVADLIVDVYKCFGGEDGSDGVATTIAEMLETDNETSRFGDFFRLISEVKVGRKTESVWTTDCAWPVFLELVRRFERTAAIDDACAKLNEWSWSKKPAIRLLFEALASSPSFDALTQEWALGSLSK